jgi:hypothetical protein
MFVAAAALDMRWAANKTRAERETILMVANATKAHRAVQDSEKQNVMPV